MYCDVIFGLFSVEFMHYVISTRSLKKVFVSIKGYYYQAEIMSQRVTWVVPHNFPHNVSGCVSVVSFGCLLF